MKNFDSIEDLVKYAETKYSINCTKVKSNLFTSEVDPNTLGLFGTLIERAYITINFRKPGCWSIGFRWKVNRRDRFDSKTLEDRFGTFYQIC
jgi:hypothetical protein